MSDQFVGIIVPSENVWSSLSISKDVYDNRLSCRVGVFDKYSNLFDVRLDGRYTSAYALRWKSVKRLERCT
jgi:hypothetical protein